MIIPGGSLKENLKRFYLPCEDSPDEDCLLWLGWLFWEAYPTEAYFIGWKYIKGIMIIKNVSVLNQMFNTFKFGTLCQVS